MRTSPILPSCLAALVAIGGALSAEPLEIAIDGGKTFQRVEGFGTCVYPYSRKHREIYATEAIYDLYVNRLGFNMLRINYSHFPHPEVASAAEIGSSTIAPAKAASVYSDFARKARALDPELRIIGTVWTPPHWMKVSEDGGNGLGRGNNSAISAGSYHNRKLGKDDPNRVKPDHVPHFVSWVSAVVGYWEEELGMPFYAISPGNEVLFSQWYESCVWTADDYARMLGMLGERLEADGHGEVLVFGPETMTHRIHRGGTGGFIEAIYGSEAATEAIDRFATHGYTDGIQQDMSASSNGKLVAALEKAGAEEPVWMTEGGTGSHEWPEVFSLEGLPVGIHNALVAGGVSAFVPWQISGGEASSHNIIEGTEFGHKAAGFAHFSKAIPVDAHRVAAEPAFGEVLASAYFKEESGEAAIVLVNPTDQARTVRLTIAGLGEVDRFTRYVSDEQRLYEAAGEVAMTEGRVEIELDAHSAVSLVGRRGGDGG